jgi:excisionase family DNA binding protein
MNNVLWTVERVAQFLVLKSNTVCHLARERRIPPYQIGNHWRSYPLQVGQWLESQAIDGPAVNSQNNLTGA